ncbi:MAG: DUF523 domain-containing protein [Lentihominibacter sp.]
MKIMVSACLLGENVKYSGGNNRNEKVLEYIKGHEVVPVCPELLGGLPVPRAPGEIQDGTVRNEDGTSVDYEYRTGAARALEIAESERIDMAILQSRSPSCGVNQIYDGTFKGRKIKGMGVFARLLSEKGYKIVDAEDI